MANSQDKHLLRHLKRHLSGQHFVTRVTEAQLIYGVGYGLKDWRFVVRCQAWARGSTLPQIGRSDQLWWSPNFLFNEYQGPVPKDQRPWIETNSSPHLVQKLIMTGATRQIPTMHSKRAQRQIYFIFILMQVWMLNEEFGCATRVIMVSYHSVAMLGWAISISEPNIVHELHINAKFEVPRL